MGGHREKTAIQKPRRERPEKNQPHQDLDLKAPAWGALLGQPREKTQCPRWSPCSPPPALTITVSAALSWGCSLPARALQTLRLPTTLPSNHIGSPAPPWTHPGLSHLLPFPELFLHLECSHEPCRLLQSFLLFQDLAQTPCLSQC